MFTVEVTNKCMHLMQIKNWVNINKDYWYLEMILENLIGQLAFGLFLKDKRSGNVKVGKNIWGGGRYSMGLPRPHTPPPRKNGISVTVMENLGAFLACFQSLLREKHENFLPGKLLYFTLLLFLRSLYFTWNNQWLFETMVWNWTCYILWKIFVVK